MTKHDLTIEDACAAMASAAAKLVEAICKSTRQPARERSLPFSSASSNGNTRRAAIRSTVGSSGSLCDQNIKSGRLYVYMFGARGLASIARTHGPRIMDALGLDKEPYVVKIGTTTLSLETRLHQIGQDRYGAAIRTSCGIEVESGFTAWVAHTISASREPADPAIELLPRAIAIELPAGMTRRQFDASLQLALKDRALNSVSPSLMPRRLVAYDLGNMRVGPARELYAMSPHDPSDGDRLLSAAEDTLRRFQTERT